MGFPTELPDFHFNVDVSGNSCTCCSNNSRKERIVYDQVNDRFVVAKHSKRIWPLCGFRCISTCCSSAPEKEENAETWKKVRELLESAQVSIPEEERMDIQKKERKGKQLKAEDLEKIHRVATKKVIRERRSVSSPNAGSVEMGDRTS